MHYVYVMANYRGGKMKVYETDDLERQVKRHKTGFVDSYSNRNNLKKLVYCEKFEDVYKAKERYKEIKGWRRSRLVKLVGNS